MYRAVIFDMDGVIIDSEPMHLLIETDFFESIGIKGAKEYLLDFYAVNLSQMLDHVIKDHSITLDKRWLYDNMIKKKYEFFKSSKLFPINGIKKILDFLKQNNIKTGLASSSAPELIDIILKKLCFTDSFDIIKSGENIQKGKPEPDIFIETAALLGVKPSECIVIEDTNRGVLAAKRAKMCCIGYINPNSGHQDLSLSDYCTSDMNDVYEYIVKLILI